MSKRKKKQNRSHQPTPPQQVRHKKEYENLYMKLGEILDEIPADLPFEEPLAQVEAGLVLALDGLRMRLEPTFAPYTASAYAVVFEDTPEADVLRSIHQLDLFASFDEAEFERDRRNGLIVDGRQNTPSKVMEVWMVATRSPRDISHSENTTH